MVEDNDAASCGKYEYGKKRMSAAADSTKKQSNNKKKNFHIVILDKVDDEANYTAKSLYKK